jgi:acyl-CoA synthetase (AMP-forming)/AMP-acid ligase II
VTGGLIDHLTSHGDQVAVITDTRQVTYGELALGIATCAADLGHRRRLVLIETRNDLVSLVRYLGALAGGHVALPLPAGSDHTAVINTYDPDVIVRDGAVEHRHGAAHDLHPELALLLSTSGSTGSPKMVRLSRTNLLANAESIASYLDIGHTDRAATTLPMSYCYGLSVVHSHLLRGASIILSEHSVVDPEFWESFRRHRGTTFAGVPHTFDLLDRIGFDAMSLPHLRYLTQAGGRLTPERVRRFAELGQRQGWQLYVMYGATEATARMGYLPPELAVDNPACIGRPIPGGSFELEPLDDAADDPLGEVGELVYRGANVMMGYAHGPADLALGRTVDALRTGDIARRHPNGMYEVVARRSRFAKMYGLRIDLQRVEDVLAERGLTAICTEDHGVLLAAVAERPDGCDAQRGVADAAGLPPSAVRVLDEAEIPRLPSGKPDYQGVRDFARCAEAPDHHELDLRAVFADVLQVDPAAIGSDRSFVELGGNSLSYVAMSVRLERTLGHLPADWQRLTLRELESLQRARPWWGATLETSVALRAVAIVLVVGSHAELFKLWGGAHILLGVAGYNFGRFCLTPLPRSERIRHLRNTTVWIAVPTVLWVALALLITDDYTASNLLLANKLMGPSASMTAGRLWFVEVVVWTLVGLSVVCCSPLADRWERRWPFGFAVAFLAFGLALRYDVFGFGLGREAWFTVLAFWYFAIGWAATKATTTCQRSAVTVVLAVGVLGYFSNLEREALVFAGLALLIWLPAIRCPAAVAVLAGVVAEASLYVYLTHYQVYPLFGGHPLLGVIASVVVGVLLTRLVVTTRTRIRDRGLRPSVRRSVPLGDEPLLRQRGGDGAVGSDQTGGDHGAPARRRG